MLAVVLDLVCPINNMSGVSRCELFEYVVDYILHKDKT